MLFSLLAVLIPLLSSFVALGLAVFVLSRNPRAWVNRWLALALSAIGVHQAILMAADLVGPGWWQLTLFRLALAVTAIIPPSSLAFSLTFGEGDSGSRLLRWRPALFSLTALVPLAWISLAMGHVVQPISLAASGRTFIGLAAWGKAYFSVYLVALALVLFHLENLYWHAARLTRWKIKFLVVGVFVAFACQIVAASYSLLYGRIHPFHTFYVSLAFFLGAGMIAFSLLRHRLLDVDIFVSRYVIYRSLTLALVVGYLLSLAVVADVFRRLYITLDLLTGTFLAILGAVGLSLLLLSEDVRRGTQRFLHTHFYRHKYDYHGEWMEFTRRLSRSTAVQEIAAQTVNRLLEVMWVNQAAMYVIGEHPWQMTLVHHIECSSLPPTLEFPETAIEALREQARLIPSEFSPEDSANASLALVREKLGEVPLGCVVPIAALDAVVGLLVVGPEASGMPFGVDDRDLLVAMAAQAGALILNARLSQEASEGRELQVLARLSAFVAHDLKNLVSMLSMLAEKAKLHMAKPEFQADAIRTLSEVTAKMRSRIVALSSPRVRMGTDARPTSLAACVEMWMQEIAGQVPSRIRLETRLGWTPEVLLDPEQFQSVVYNLVLNAIEAIPERGTIRVETTHENGYAILAVTDTGRGMTEEFIKHRLFRPFQTTKPRGVGIGLYQCRQIIHAAGGTLTAESKEGKGTRMLIRLPLTSALP